MPSSAPSATNGIAATPGEVAVDIPPTASKEFIPSTGISVTPVEIATDIPRTPPIGISVTPGGGDIFIDLPPTPSKESMPSAFRPSNLQLFMERTLFVALLLGVVGFVSWYIFTTQVYTKHDPEFQIDSASVDTSVISIQFDRYIKADWTIGISARNPNEHTPIVYRKVAVRMSRHSDEFTVSDAIAASFLQEPGNQTTLVARSEPQSKGTKLAYEILETVLEFNVTMQVELSYKCWACLREATFELGVACPQVEVFHASNGPKIGVSQQCSVQSRRQIK